MSKSAPKNRQLIDTPAPVLTPAPALTPINVNPSSADHFHFSTPNHADLFENPIEFEVNKNIAVIKTFFNKINFTEIEKIFTADVKSNVRLITLLAYTAKDWEKFNQVKKEYEANRVRNRASKVSIHISAVMDEIV